MREEPVEPAGRRKASTCRCFSFPTRNTGLDSWGLCTKLGLVPIGRGWCWTAGRSYRVWEQWFTELRVHRERWAQWFCLQGGASTAWTESAALMEELGRGPYKHLIFDHTMAKKWRRSSIGYFTATPSKLHPVSDREDFVGHWLQIFCIYSVGDSPFFW